MTDKNYTIIHGNALESCKKLAKDGIKVNSIITSPPYWQKRDYGFSEQWGNEKTPIDFLKNLWSLMEVLWDVLADDGTCWINLGDTYSRGNRKFYGRNNALNKSLEQHTSPNTHPVYDKPNKSLLLIPQRFVIGCSDTGWVVRNDIIWGKTNAKPESVKDRLSTKYEHVFFMTKLQKYYFNLDAIREPHKQSSINRIKHGAKNAKYNKTKYKEGIFNDLSKSLHKKGKNPGDITDFWALAKVSRRRSNHFAAFSEELIKRPVMAGCPENGIILDPFCGTGTTGAVALSNNRRFIGIDGNADYVSETKKRLKSLNRKIVYC